MLTDRQLEKLLDDQNGYMSRVTEVLLEQHWNPVTPDASTENDRKCLVLDVDNTLIYVRHFMDEMRVGDMVKRRGRKAVVTKLTYKLELEFSDTPGEIIPYDHVLGSEDDPLPQRGEWFPDEQQKVAMIHKADPTGCDIELLSEHDIEHRNIHISTDEMDELESIWCSIREPITISFVENNDELLQLEPMLHRDNYLPVDFKYGGYLVRIRPGLAQFLSHCNDYYDVILWSGADGSVYRGLMKKVRRILRQQLKEQRPRGKLLVSGFLRQFEQNGNKMIRKELRQEISKWFDTSRRTLWQQMYFRSDCDEKCDEHGFPYRHKNLAKLGRDLSKIVMVDDNPLSYRGFEPNSVRVASFWGLAQPPDDELMTVLFPLLQTVANHDDVRYYLSGLGQPPLDTVNNNECDTQSDEYSGMYSILILLCQFVKKQAVYCPHTQTLNWMHLGRWNSAKRRYFISFNV